jgi:hypothetical protein
MELVDYNFNNSSHSWNEDNWSAYTDFSLSAVQSEIDKLLASDRAAGLDMLSEFSRAMKKHGSDEENGFKEFRDYYATQSADYVRAIDDAGIEKN